MKNTQIAANVETVRQRIREAAIRSGRTETDVKLVAVSKYVSTTDGVIDALLAAGCRDLGEARPQILLEKAEFFAQRGPGPQVPAHISARDSARDSEDEIRWHLIGSLQRNKIRKVLPLVSLIHSVDSVRLAEAIDRIADDLSEETGRPIRPCCLLEVAISGDETKHGFEPEDFSAVLDQLAVFQNISVFGLMGMSGLNADVTETRRQFAALRQLAESLQKRGTPENVSLAELSMGMSGDFDIAIEEGATLVRVGSLLYAE